ncbi:MAG: AraC family transcriptional regulator [Nitratireductor sp.]|nr:AraC family transcriptional regulator [Nitratireductor sp.]
MLTKREYGWERGTGSPLESVMFSRTDSFAFSDSSRPYLKIETATLGARGLKLSLVTSSGHEIRLTEHEHVTLLLPTRGSLDVAIGAREFRAIAGQSLVFPPNSRCTRVIGTPRHHYVALVLQVPTGAMKPGPLVDEKIDLSRLVGDGAFLGGSHEIVHALRHYLEYLVADLSREAPFLQSSHAKQAAEALAMEQFLRYLAALGEEPDRAASLAAGKVREVEAFMRANFAEPLMVSDIARAVGVGTRALQTAFRQNLGTTPHGSLVSIRMEKAREAICGAGQDQSVTQIALACGFTHLGRFSQLYRQTYGELPSETLRKR